MRFRKSSYSAGSESCVEIALPQREPVRFRKSSYSSGSAETCVEIALPQGDPVRFKKSSYSNTSGETCVEIALPEGIHIHPEPILIRDSKRPDGPTLRVAAEPYRSFTRALRRGTLGAPHGDGRKGRVRLARPIP
ncbi:DUF397 domain-containing protein [Streptomyces sp. XH2]|uniref:DUF397 domain-containing protein n=1 Tax=Streptomyces sp. XH2 TaxID=3412483 RepID=UPI003C7998BA